MKNKICVVFTRLNRKNYIVAANTSNLNFKLIHTRRGDVSSKEVVYIKNNTVNSLMLFAVIKFFFLIKLFINSFFPYLILDILVKTIKLNSVNETLIYVWCHPLGTPVLRLKPGAYEQ